MAINPKFFVIYASKQKEGEYSVEPVLHRPQPEKSGTIRTEVGVICREKVKLFANKAIHGGVLPRDEGAEKEKN